MSFPKALQKSSLILFLILLMTGCASAEQTNGYPPQIPIEENGPMVVPVQVTLEAARVLQNQSDPTPSSEELIAVLEELEISLEPLHPGTGDPVLITFFTVDVVDADMAEKVINQLLQSDAVEAAYLKPPAEPAGIP